MPRICLVYPDEMRLPHYFRAATNISTDVSTTLPPLGLLYIIANSRHAIDLIDNRVSKLPFDDLLSRLTEYDVIGFGGTIFEIKQARRLSAALMRAGRITLYGGPNATVNWKLYLGEFSLIFRGEAELQFDPLMDGLDRPEQAGFVRMGATYVNPAPFRVRDLDALRFPDRSRIRLDDYERTAEPYLRGVRPVDVLISSRGCPFDCYFCSSKVIWDQRYTYRSVEDLLGEIRLLVSAHGTKGLYFREDNFTVNRRRLLEFCGRMEGEGLAWMCESRVDTLDEEAVEAMARAGCRGVWFGIESTDDEVLRRIRKNTTRDQIRRTIDLCNRHGIVTGGGFMLGFPFDDRESILRNYRTSRQLGLKVRFYNRVWAVPISQMHTEIVHESLDEYSFENIVLPATRHLSADELNRLYYRLVSRRDLFRKFLIRLAGQRTVAFVKRRLPWLFRLAERLLR